MKFLVNLVKIRKMPKYALIILSMCSVTSCAIYTFDDNIINVYNDLLTASTAIVPPFSQFTENLDSNKYTETVDIVQENGYPVESHTAVTEDGYVLTVHRIPGSPKSPPSASKRPVLIMHGQFAASDTWVVLGPGHSLGFLLADEGFDVWLGNVRGNFYSRKHVLLSPENPAFWNFSFHEMGVYDLPTTIDLILNVTGQEQIFYIGHSMGTSMFFVMASTRLEYNQKIRLMVAFAPIVYFKHIRIAGVEILVENLRTIYMGLSNAGVYEVLPRTPRLQQLINNLCRDRLPTFWLCISLYFTAFGGSIRNVNRTMVPEMLSHLLSGASINTITHFVENYRTDRFQWFDPTITLGKVMPAYDMGKVVAPVALYYAEQDVYAHPDGVAQLKSELPNVVQTVKIAVKDTGHMDFVFGTQAKTYIYNQVIVLLKQYS